MGVSIDLFVSTDVKQSEWDVAYDAALRFVTEFPFMDLQAKAMYGYPFGSHAL